MNKQQPFPMVWRVALLAVLLLASLALLPAPASAQARDDTTLPTLTCPAGYTLAYTFPTANPYDVALLSDNPTQSEANFTVNILQNVNGILTVWSGMGHPEFRCGQPDEIPSWLCGLPDQPNEAFYVLYDGATVGQSVDSGEHIWVQQPSIDLGLVTPGDHTFTFRHVLQGVVGPTISVYYLAGLCTQPPPADQCTYTQGYWKNHPEAWPVNALTLGSVNYNQAQLLAILNQPVRGNGLISLAHQLIAAKLNAANGADSSVVSGAFTSADALIGGLVVPPVGSGYLAPRSTSGLIGTLDNFNNGVTGPGHCG